MNLPFLKGHNSFNIKDDTSEYQYITLTWLKDLRLLYHMLGLE